MASNPRWLVRYLDGQEQVVWHELRQLGARVREPAFAAEAQAVCDEMARRARFNVEVLIERLLAQGYRFHENDNQQTPAIPLAGPSPDAEAFVHWLQETFGMVPMALSSWVRIVGDVWLVGTHPQWEYSEAADPLVVEVEGTRYPDADIKSYFLDELDGWRQYPGGRPFQLPVAPDHLHKGGESGGSPYGIVLPDACADAYIVTTNGMSFVAYLRQVFEEGGFAMWTGYGGLVKSALSAGLKPL